jgi:hypothetical protein
MAYVDDVLCESVLMRALRDRPPKASTKQQKEKTMKLRILTVPVLFALIITTASAQYLRTDLVSNQPGVAPFTDSHLVNAWGLVALPTSPWWVSDNGTGFSTLYNGTGQQIPLFVTVPPAPSQPAGTLGTPTGIVGNISTNATDFTVTENGMSTRSIFIFATLAVGIPLLAVRQATVMPLWRLIDRARVQFTRAWLSRPTNKAKLSCMQPMVARTAELTCSMAPLLW